MGTSRAYLELGTMSEAGLRPDAVSAPAMRTVCVESHQSTEKPGREAELAKSNSVLRAAANNLARVSEPGESLARFLKCAVNATVASGGGILRRTGKTEFTFVAILQDGVLISGDELAAHPLTAVVREKSRLDPSGYFARLAAGETVWRLSTSKDEPLDEIEHWHNERSNVAFWDIPFKTGNDVAGYLGLAFHHQEGPNDILRETIEAFANQVGIALELTRLADASKQSAILRERESAAMARAAELELANQALRKGIDGLGRLGDLSHFLGEMLKAAVATAGAQSGGVVILNEGSQTYRVHPLLRAHGGFEPEGTDLTSALPLSQAVKGLFCEINAATTAWLMTETDDRMDREFVNFHKAEGNLSVAHIPMRVDDRLIGMLGLGFPTAQPHFEKEFGLLRSLADQMTLAVEMVRLSNEAKSAAVAREQERAAKERADELELANRALRKGIAGLGKLDDLRLFLGEMLKAAASTAGAHAGGINLIDYDTATWRVSPMLRATGDLEPSDSEVCQPQPMTPGIQSIFEDIDHSSTAWVTQPEARMGPLYVDFHRREGNKTIAHIPMRAGNRLIGLLGLGFDQEHVEFGKEFSVLRSLADQMTLAVEMVRLSDEAKSAAVAREREAAALARAKELSRANEELSLRDQLLTATAKALEQLMSSTDFSAGVVNALGQIGETARLSRVQVLLEASLPSEILAHELLHEWWGSSLSSQIALGYRTFPNQDFQEVVDKLHAGERWWARTDDWPKAIQGILRGLGIVWTGVVPIFVQQQYVGLVAFDQCDETLDWSEAEIDALTIAAQGIGAALSQQRMAAQIVGEREQAAQERAAELVKANHALRCSVDDLVTQTTTDGILTSLLKQAINISGANSGAILRRVGGSEFEYVTIYANGAFRSSQAILAAGTNTEMRFASRLDPTGHFAGLARGEMRWRAVEEPVLGVHLKRSTKFHREAGNRCIYDFPYQVSGQVFGSLGLAFAGAQLPTETIQETIKALATQVGLALEFRRISEQVERAAILEERGKFARDLHDTLAQGFTAILIQLGAADQSGPIPEKLMPYLDRIDTLARKNLAEARKTVIELRTSERVQEPLVERLDQLARQLEAVYSNLILLDVTGTPHTLPPVVEDEMYLIAREAVTNALKHAEAGEVKIEVQFRPDGLKLKVKDNGKGFSSEERGKVDHFGLQTMQERSQRISARLTIISEPGFGSEILTFWSDTTAEIQ